MITLRTQSGRYAIQDPIGPLRFDFGYNLNPTRYFQTFTAPSPIGTTFVLRPSAFVISTYFSA